MALRTLSICAGVGGLDLGVRIARPDARCVAFVEREASAAASLVASMEAGRLHPAAIWSDLRTFVAGEWRGAVDCVLSGDPCQGNSVAGKRLGADDDRWLLDRAIEVFDESGAHTFFRENVPGNLAGQLEVAIPALERLGCRVAAGIFSAAEAGASHRRERFFIMAHRDGAQPPAITGDDGEVRRFSEAQRQPEYRPTLSGRGRNPMGNTQRGGDCRNPTDAGRGSIVGIAAQWAGSGHIGEVDDAELRRRRKGRHDYNEHDRYLTRSAGRNDLVDAEGQRWGEGWSEYAGQQRRSAVAGPGGTLARPLFAPGPSDPIWGEIIRDAPSLEPAVCGVAHGVAGRIERIRHCGNGVVPLAAALAWVRLHGLLADEAAGGAFRAADDSTARAGQSVVRAAA